MKPPASRNLVAGILVLVSLALLVLSLSGFLGSLQGMALRPMAAAQEWISVRVTTLRNLLAAPSDVVTLRQQNSGLQAEVARLQREVITLREQAAEAEILGGLLNYARSKPESRYLAANVIGRDVSPYLRSIWIGSGTDNGIARGMPVVTERGLVGRVVEAFPTAARVQLITDPQAAVNVRLQDSRADGVTVAQPNGELWMDQINQGVAVAAGELVLTSGLGGGYPADIIVGQVASVRTRDYELFQRAVLQPGVDFEALEIVLVITSFQPLPVEAGGT
ncbi:MAG: rod shape-determining protein MreC [Anaerolineales bacterium]|nr:rod shape-determining protein MreC [Anaerolineales bacterium]